MNALSDESVRPRRERSYRRDLCMPMQPMRTGQGDPRLQRSQSGKVSHLQPGGLARLHPGAEQVTDYELATYNHSSLLHFLHLSKSSINQPNTKSKTTQLSSWTRKTCIAWPSTPSFTFTKFTILVSCQHWIRKLKITYSTTFTNTKHLDTYTYYT